MIAPEKHLLILQANPERCDCEINQIHAIAEMLGMSCRFRQVDSAAPKPAEEFKKSLESDEKADYVYLCAHADQHGFAVGGEKTEEIICWNWFATGLCEAECLNKESILFLACCRGGLKRVAHEMFDWCADIDYICGPRWTVCSHDLVAGFHVFIYNMEVRHEQPSCAAYRASQATGYDFYCYDRVEVEDSLVGSNSPCTYRGSRSDTVGQPPPET